MNKNRKEIFVSKANKKHGNKYDYTKVEYVNNSTKVCIICPEHGEFWMTPANHVYGQGCPKCGVENRSRKRTKKQDEILKKFEQIHGSKYDYSKVEYNGIDTKVCIVCPAHGEYYQTPYHHINGCGCPKCAGNKKSNTEEFIEKAKKIHGDKYDYSKVEYIGTDIKVCIICQVHGEFWMTPSNHLKGSGCPKCVGKNKTTEDFIKECNNKHKNKYDYSKTVYNGAFNKVCVICPEHGEFNITPHDHLQGRGCPICGTQKQSEKQRKCIEQFKEDVENIYGEGYLDLSKVVYVNARTPVTIISPDLGEKTITPNKLLSKTGCKLFAESVYEHEVKLSLLRNGIKFIKEKTFNWLKDKSFLRLDFYLPDYNIAIECQGRQHFTRLKHYFNQKSFEEQLKRDKIKNKLCEENGIKIIYYTHKENMCFNEYYDFYNNCLYNNIDELIKNIKQHG